MFEHGPAIPESGAAVVARRLLHTVPRLALGALFLYVGYTKFDGDPAGPWFGIFEQIGLGQWFRVFTGIVLADRDRAAAIHPDRDRLGHFGLT